MQIQEREQELPPKTPARRSLDEAHGLYRVGIAYGRRIYRLRWVIIAIWVVVVGASIPFTLKVGDVLTGGGYSYDNSESAKVDTIISTTVKQPPSQFLVVFQSDTKLVGDAGYQQEVNAFISRARAYSHVTGIQQSGAGLDGRTMSVTVSLSISSSDATKNINDFRAILPSGGAASPAHVYLSGGPAIDAAFNTITESDVEHAELAALPIALLVLLVVFGTLVAATMPLLLAVVSVPVALAVIYAIAQHVTMSIFVLNIVSIIGLGISIDYSLFMLRRFRDELASGGSIPDAVGNTIATSGEAILFSGLIVMIGFSALLLIGIPFMTSLGIGGAVVVAIAALAALTLLPALLSVLGPRVNALRIPLIGRLTAPHAHKQQHENGNGDRVGVGSGANIDERRGFWQRWAEGVMRRPVLVILAVSAILIGLGWPIFSIELGTPSVSSLPTSDESRRGIDILNAQFPETRIDPVYIVAQAPDGSSMLLGTNLTKLDTLSRWIARQAHVTGVVSLTQLPATPGAPTLTEQELATLYSSGGYKQSPALAQLVASTTSGNTTIITVMTNAKLDSSDGNALIDDLRSGDTTAGQGLTVLVGGSQASDLDFNRYLYGNFPRSVIFILIATYLLLLLMFRSVFLPLKAILMNVLSVAACYGLLVFVFQWGNYSNILGFTPNGYLDSTNPILLFCILFGLSMDYEVFLLSRIHEEWLRTHNNRYAVARGLEKTGGVITNAALLFVIVTGAFTFTQLLITKEIGLGMSIAVLLDAAVIRTLLVPATMRLLGRWNWWLPGRPLPPKQAG
ncbi:MAG TPA: MMPL family transporter [Ktedonobacteraceae bacterium]|nr:MMPL family transporter [Ktedonobacteraceae bacterium]